MLIVSIISMKGIYYMNDDHDCDELNIAYIDVTVIITECKRTVRLCYTDGRMRKII